MSLLKSLLNHAIGKQKMNRGGMRDVCHAVLATLRVSLARGESWRDTCKLAVMTATEQVSQIGIAPMLNAALPA